MRHKDSVYRIALKNALKDDLAIVGIEVDTMILDLRPYHHRFYGKYEFSKNKVVLYLYEDKKCTFLRSYDRLLETAIHEGSHHMMNREMLVTQGSVHSPRFYELYNHFIEIAKTKNLLTEGGV